ncbi:MAG: VCBS repeat-containing protein [candidate division Zixibacteria bacterium]
MLVLSLLAGVIIGCSDRPDQNPALIDELRLPGDLCDFITADFDGDSLLEVLAFGCYDRGSIPSRWGAAYFVNGGRFDTSQVIRFDIPDNAILFDTGDIDGDGRPEALYLADDGLYSIKIDRVGADEPRRIIQSKTIFLLPTPRFASHWDFFRELSGNDRNLVIIPSIASIGIYSIQNGVVKKSDDISYKLHAHSSSPAIAENRISNQLGFDFDLPFFEFLDFDGDGIEDLYIIDDDAKVDIYTRSFDGGFSDEPVSSIDGKYRAGNGENNAGIKILPRDINGDGLGDLVISSYTGGIKDLESKIEVYFCRSRGSHDSVASFRHTIPNSEAMLFLTDLNHDGRMDMVIPAFRMGITALLKMLVLNRVDLGLEIFLQQPGAIFPEIPSMSTAISTTIDLNSSQGYFGANIASGGDFNGDRLCDFLIETGDGTIDIYYGSVGNVLESEPGWTYQLPIPSSIIAEDCDNDGISEIFAFYNNAPTERDIIRVIHVGR